MLFLGSLFRELQQGDYVMSIGLLILNGKDKGAFREVPERGDFSIGRDHSCLIRLDEEMASKNHAYVSRRDDGLLIRDASSRNGTYVNGRRIEEQLIREGDTITVGITVLRVSKPVVDPAVTSIMTSLYGGERAVDVSAPIPRNLFDQAPQMVECTKQLQALLDKHTDTMVKESMKILFNILPVTRLSLFNVEGPDSLSQGYTVVRKSKGKVDSMSRSVALQVLKEKQAVFIKDTAEVKPDGTLGTSIGFKDVQSIIGVPVTIQGQLKAVLLGDNLEEPNVLTETHLRVMQFAAKALEVLHQRDAMYKLDNMGSFLPICARCKKIRDDRGYWNVLEAFITQRAAVQFSHGYCPECFENEAREMGIEIKP
jgi:pSer/pThr/pTyr-binding forkhead associated (FHA) protein